MIERPKPYKTCKRTGCEKLIPWPRKSGKYVKRSRYEEKKYCGKQCKSIAVQDRMYKKELKILKKINPSLEDEFAMPFVHFDRFDDIVQCRKCGSLAFHKVSIGKSCWSCGKLWLVREGDWKAEKARRGKASLLGWQ